MTLFLILFRFLLGGTFFLTGLSKIPIYQAFVYSIYDLLPAPDIILYPLAVIVIIIELTAGLAIMLNYQTKLFSGILSVLIVLFIVFLTGAIFRHEQYICKCFGVLGLELAVAYQIAVDFVLLIMATTIFVFSSPSKYFPALNNLLNRVSSRKLITGVFIVAVLWSGLVIAQPQFVFGERKTTIDFNNIFSHITESYRASHLEGTHIVFLVDMGDFYCPSCIDDFLYFCHTLEEYEKVVQENIFIIVRKIEFLDIPEQEELLAEWKQMHEVSLPMVIDGENLVERSNVDKTVVIVFGETGNVKMYETFPMGSRRRTEVLQTFFDGLTQIAVDVY